MKRQTKQLEKVDKVSNIPIENVEVGQWYWVVDEKDGDWLGCVMHVGSNYIKLHSPKGHYGYSTIRVHFDDFFIQLKRELDFQKIINENTEHFKNEVRRLLTEVKMLTDKLGVSQQAALPFQQKSEQNALVVLSNQNSIKDYESALIIAKDKQLPDLFKQIKTANEEMAKWMSAPLLPLQATINGLDGITGNIKDRIFNVSLYAGLTEDVVKCCDGKPAEFIEKLHVMQRRLYMDEECLLNYKTGGMDFKSISEFDEWLCVDENKNRILPFKRCLVAMRIRRDDKVYEEGDPLSRYISIKLNEINKLTFLYIRNGEQVWRLNCDLEFDEMIFPDRAFFDPREEKMAKLFAGKVDKIITKNEYDEIVREYKDKKKKYNQWLKDNPANTWDKSKGSRDFSNPFRNYEYDFHHSEYRQFNPSDVYYDDILKVLSDEAKKYNRIALIIQGLFDRSEVLHPHPSVKMWTREGFDIAVKLVYDGDTSVLYGGEKPDFEVYRKKCNESITADSMCVGQELYWMKKEADKENKVQASKWRIKNPYHHAIYKPHNNSGPGYLSKVVSFKKRSKQAIFRWHRERIVYSVFEKNDDIPCSITVPIYKLFNVDAYKIDDYKQFFQDPRTRAEYLKWAPMLLAAEEYHRNLRGDKSDE